MGGSRSRVEDDRYGDRITVTDWQDEETNDMLERQGEGMMTIVSVGWRIFFRRVSWGVECTRQNSWSWRWTIDVEMLSATTVEGCDDGRRYLVNRLWRRFEKSLSQDGMSIGSI